MGSAQSQDLLEKVHALRQPLNVMRLTLSNLRHRISVDGDKLDLANAEAKLDSVDLQIQRMADLIEAFLVTRDDIIS